MAALRRTERNVAAKWQHSSGRSETFPPNGSTPADEAKHSRRGTGRLQQTQPESYKISRQYNIKIKIMHEVYRINVVSLQ
jgi:hypothetical protein